MKEIYRVIEELPQQGISLLLVEQHTVVALGVANRGYVLETGRIVLQGAGKELLEDEKVKKAYLGIT